MVKVIMISIGCCEKIWEEIIPGTPGYKYDEEENTHEIGEDDTQF